MLLKQHGAYCLYKHIFKQKFGFRKPLVLESPLPKCDISSAHVSWMAILWGAYRKGL
jgi:hypothetical protein